MDFSARNSSLAQEIFLALPLGRTAITLKAGLAMDSGDSLWEDKYVGPVLKVGLAVTITSG